MTENRDDDILFDLLADGALGEDERRSLLLRLDALPDGWRRCALAFLESQAWGEAMSAPAVVHPPAARRWRRALAGRRGPMLIAAGLMACFAAGFVASGRRHGGGMERQDGPEAAPPAAAASTANPDDRGDASDGGVRLAGEAVIEVKRGGEAGEVALPVLEGLDPDRFSDLPPVFTPTMTRAIERRGHVVNVSRQIVEVTVGEGRTLLIPVDELRVAAARWRL